MWRAQGWSCASPRASPLLTLAGSCPDLYLHSGKLRRHFPGTSGAAFHLSLAPRLVVPLPSQLGLPAAFLGIRSDSVCIPNPLEADPWVNYHTLTLTLTLLGSSCSILCILPSTLSKGEFALSATSPLVSESFPVTDPCLSSLSPQELAKWYN